MKADCCGECGTQLQPLQGDSRYTVTALQLAAENDIARPSDLLLALLAHVLVVHPGLQQVPALVPFERKVKR